MRSEVHLPDEQRSRLQERALSLALPHGGVEIRPTRVFLWIGDRDRGREWLYSLGLEPRLLRLPRRRRHLQVGRLRVSYFGNPAVTLALFAGRLFRRLRSGRGLPGESLSN